MQMEEVEKSPDGREAVLCDARRLGVNCRQGDVDRDGGHNYECGREGGRSGPRCRKCKTNCRVAAQGELHLQETLTVKRRKHECGQK